MALHFLVPALIVGMFFQQKWLLVYGLMMLTMIVDVDHLWAVPVYDVSRCSVGFHLLHQFQFIAFYVVLSFIPKTRYIGYGLIVHMVLDSIDCQVTNGIWFV